MNGNNDWQDEPFYQEISSESNFGGESGLATPFIILGLIATVIYVVLICVSHSKLPYILEAHFNFSDVIHNKPPLIGGTTRKYFSTGNTNFHYASCIVGLYYILGAEKHSTDFKKECILICVMVVTACFQYNDDMMSFYEFISNDLAFRELCLSIYKKMIIFRLFLFIPILLATKVFSPDDFSLDNEKYSWLRKVIVFILVITSVYCSYLAPTRF